MSCGRGAHDLRRVLGGLPETFGSGRAEMHRYAAVDHATAFYIKSILAGIKFGSNSGKIVAQLGIDWKKWGRKGAAVTNFAFSELFTNSVGMPQTHPGYHGPIVLSRGVGGGQATAPTLVKGVSPAGRQEVEDYEWAGGRRRRRAARRQGPKRRQPTTPGR